MIILANTKGEEEVKHTCSASRSLNTGPSFQTSDKTVPALKFIKEKLHENIIK
jgi:hypothetical protein